MRGNRKSSMAAVVAMAIAASANAGTTFFQFTADPDGAAAPKEFSYNPATGLSEGPGAIGNNAGTSPGMGGVITGGLAGIPFSPPALAPIPPLNQILQDLTIDLTGFAATGNAVIDATTITQPLTGGSFSIYYDAGGTQIPLVLLTGTAVSASVIEKNSGEASVLSGDVTYTGGLLHQELLNMGSDGTGTFAFALSGLDGPYATVLVGSDTRLAGFNADAVGTFDVNFIPEPTMALSAAAVLGVLGAGRSRRRA